MIRRIRVLALFLTVAVVSGASPAAPAVGSALTAPAPAQVRIAPANLPDVPFRISDMGATDGVATFDARDPALAYNDDDDEFMVVWRGSDDGAGLAAGEVEIFGQRIVANTGTENGSDLLISAVGGTGVVNGREPAGRPAIAYDGNNGRYLVVWSADEIGLADDEHEIYGQCLAGDGSPFGGTFRISDMGTDNDAAIDAVDPAIAYDPALGQFLVVWSGDDDTALLVDDEFEIYGQLVSGTTCAPTGANDFRISSMGTTDGSAAFGAHTPAVVHNTITTEYLVVWSGDDDTAPLVDDELEIFGQRLSNAGAELGTDDFRISDMGTDGTTDGSAVTPAVAFTDVWNRFFVAWSGDDGGAGQEFEIYGQQLAFDMTEIGTNDQQISNAGPAGNESFDATSPTTIYDPPSDTWAVAFAADDSDGSLVDDELEIYFALLELPTADLKFEIERASSAGTDGDATRDADRPAVAFGATNGARLLVWEADDPDFGAPALADDEFEIFGVRVRPGAFVLDWAGGIYVGDGAVAFTPQTPYFGFNVARDMELSANNGAYVLDGFGGVHTGGDAPPLVPAPPYFGFDIAKDLELASGGGGYVLDGFGGVHAIGGAAVLAPATPYFGFNVARDMELAAGGGHYVLDGFGGLHSGGGAAPLAPAPPYFGFDIAKDLELAPAGGGYTLDGFGGVHAVGGAPVIAPATPYFGFDIARDMELEEGGYYVLDGFGALHNGGAAVRLPSPMPYISFDAAVDYEIRYLPPPPGQ